MSEKHPAWTRLRVGRGRVRWVAYDDRVGAEGCQVVAQGYAASLVEADAAARSALADHGHYQARRASTAFRPASAEPGEKPRRPPRRAPPKRERPPEYLYTRRHDDREGYCLAAHRIVKKTARRVYVSRASCGPDQLGTADERWDEAEPTLALDRLKLERDGSVYSSGHRHSDFYASRETAQGEAEPLGPAAFRRLDLRPPCSIEDIKVAYRRKALEAHPDRGGTPADFQAIETAYRQLLREAQSSEG